MGLSFVRDKHSELKFDEFGLPLSPTTAQKELKALLNSLNHQINVAKKNPTFQHLLPKLYQERIDIETDAISTD